MNEMVTITVERAEFDASIARLISLGTDASKPMAAVSMAMYRNASEVVFSEDDPWGHHWPPLAPKTIRKRQHRGNYSTKALIDTGAMYRSMRPSSTANTAEVSIDAPMEVHQYGATVHTKDGDIIDIPPRPIFPDHGDGADPPESWWAAVGAPIYTALEAAA
jgi:hypothetical protein